MKSETIHEYEELLEEGLFSFRENEFLPDQNNSQIKGEDEILSLFKTGNIDYDERFILKTEACLLKLAYAFNKILSLSNSRTRILAHQVESTDQIVNAIQHRFLIADEVGLGKTVEAGLVIKEFIYRYNFKRILISCPASLLYQWQNEMKSKFNEDFIIMDRKTLKAAESVAGEKGNPWKVHDKIICSLDFIKNINFAEDIKSTSWDAVVFDEAHRLRRDSNSSTKVYNVAEIISEKTKSLLLLSATPFRGKLEELYYLVYLLDKNVLGPFQSFYNDYCLENSDLSGLKEKLSAVVIRRTKNDIGGFTKRYAKTIKFELYPDERYLYEETTRYVAEEFNRALQTENRATGFVMTVFQKLLDSSSYALHCALRNRMFKLKEMIEKAERGEKDFSDLIQRFDPLLDDDSEDLETVTDFSIEKTVAELKVEVQTISKLVDIAGNIKVNKKGEKLKSLIARLRKKGTKKFLIFTQFRTTQDYLADILSNYKTVVFNGSMSADEKEDAIEAFKGDTEVLIATEAGGEGRNMQFCNVIINYDLPWSPLKIEQRIGRLHRFGQPKDVFIYNFSTSGTVAERVLEVLTDKLKLFEESIGAPDVMLGQIEDELKLNSIFMEMVSGKKSRKEINEEIKRRMSLAKKSYEKLESLTVTDKMDFNYDEYYRITMKEREFSSTRVENFIEYLRKVDDYPTRYLGTRNHKDGLFPVKAYPSGREFSSRFGTFDSESALENENIEFLAFGHPIVDHCIDYCISENFGGLTGVRVIETGIKAAGFICNYIVSFESVSKTAELMPVVIPVSDNLGEFEIGEMEREAVQQAVEKEVDLEFYYNDIKTVVENCNDFFSKASERIRYKVDEKIRELTDNLDMTIDPQIEKVEDSFNKRMKELEEKLELQQCQMKWYGKDMKSAITRTKNLILRAEREKNTLLEKYQNYFGVKSDIRMLNAGIIISI